jgi:hypothetical protein
MLPWRKIARNGSLSASNFCPDRRASEIFILALFVNHSRRADFLASRIRQDSRTEGLTGSLQNWNGEAMRSQNASKKHIGRTKRRRSNRLGFRDCERPRTRGDLFPGGPVERLTAARFWPSSSTPSDSQATTLRVLNSHRSRWVCSVGWNAGNSCGCWQWSCSGRVVRSSFQAAHLSSWRNRLCFRSEFCCEPCRRKLKRSFGSRCPAGPRASRRGCLRQLLGKLSFHSKCLFSLVWLAWTLPSEPRI